MAAADSDLPVGQRIASIGEALELLHGSVDRDALEARAAELESQMGATGFWDDPEAAAKVSAEHTRATRKAEAFRSLAAEVDDLGALAELADEDEDMAAELGEQLGVL